MKKAIECENMQDIRAEIDNIDSKIVELIALRSGYVKEAAKFKNSETAVKDTGRVEQVINSKKLLAEKYGVSSELIGKIYSTIIDHFINEELEEWVCRKPMRIRPYKIGEEKELFQVFYSSIRENAKQYYTREQLFTWAPDKIEFDIWAERIRKINPFVVVENETILAYGDLQENGYIDHFFVRGGYAKMGIGKSLMNHIINTAKEKGISNLFSNVSLAAEGFFESYGFKVVKRKEVEIRNVLLKNALMELKLKN